MTSPSSPPPARVSASAPRSARAGDGTLTPRLLSIVLALVGACSGEAVDSAGAASSESASNPSGASDTASTTAADPSGSTGPCSPAQCPDLGMDTGADPAGCSIFAQDCPGDQKCTVYAQDGGSVWNDTRCAPIPAAPKGAGESCAFEGNPSAGVDDCDRGLFCANEGYDPVSFEPVRVCRRFCSGSEAQPLCPDAGDICNPWSNGIVYQCDRTCNPLRPSCPPDDICARPGGDFLYCTRDTSDMTPLDGAPCPELGSGSCGAGKLCMPSAFLAQCDVGDCCTSFCDTDAPNSCPLAAQGAKCVPWFDALPPPGFETLGFCGVS